MCIRDRHTLLPSQAAANALRCILRLNGRISAQWQNTNSHLHAQINRLHSVSYTHLANPLEPIFQIGKEGISDNLISQLDDALDSREMCIRDRSTSVPVKAI